MAIVQLEPDVTNEDVTVQDDGRVYLTQKIAGETVNLYAELVPKREEDGEEDDGEDGGGEGGEDGA